MFWVNPLQLGVTRTSGECILHGFDENSSNQGTSFLIQSPEHKNKQSNNDYTINVISIDDFVGAEQLNRLDLLKIDVEGFDVDVLAGATESIKRFRPIILFEYCLGSALKNKHDLFDDIYASLLSLGYSFYSIKYNFLIDFDKRTLCGNERILCIPGNRLLSHS